MPSRSPPLFCLYARMISLECPLSVYARMLFCFPSSLSAYVHAFTPPPPPLQFYVHVRMLSHSQAFWLYASMLSRSPPLYVYARILFFFASSLDA